MKFIAITLLFALVGTSVALKCYNDVVTGNKDHSGDETREEINCGNDDKYCISFGGQVASKLVNQSVTINTCEKKLKSKVKFIEDIIGKQIVISCAEDASESKKQIGDFTFSYTCCKTDLCNSGVLGLVLSPLLTLSALFVARFTQFA